MSNLELYDKVRVVPSEAQKSIGGGRLKGMTDINPMWRIKTLTEQFGMIGFGWVYKITDKRLEKGGKDEIAAFVDIELKIKVGGEWSEPIVGTGGSSFVASESKGLFTSDECFKMALTDALSVACKALGIGADVYWSKDSTKYTKQGDEGKGNGNDSGKCDYAQELIDLAQTKGFTIEDILKRYKIDSGKSVSEVKYINKDGKVKLTEDLKKLPDKE